MNNKIMIKDYVSITRDNHFFYIISQKVLKINFSEKLEKALEDLQQGCLPSDISLLLGEKDADILITNLKKNDMLVNKWENEYKGTVVEKQLYFFEQFNKNPNLLQEKLTKARVALIGVGGVGSIILQNLISSGVKKFVLVDFDEVSLGNLNRQFIYDQSSIGLLKTDEAKKYIRSIDEFAEVQTYDKKIDTIKDLDFLDQECLDIIINAADMPSNIADIIYEYAKQRSIAYITGGVGIFGGFWGPLFTKSSYRKQINYTSSNLYISRKPIKGSIGATNSIISTFMAYDVVKYLIGVEAKSFEKRVYLNFDDLKFKYNYYDKEINENANISSITKS